MKTDVLTLQDSFRIGYEEYEHSKIEAAEVWELYHNRQWNQEQLNLLEMRGQPKETFNVIKLFSRMLIGYYSTILNTVTANPVQPQDQTLATLATDSIKSIFETNRLDVKGDKIKLDAFISGLMIAHLVPEKTGEVDKFGRPVYEIKIRAVPSWRVVLDPMSEAEDYSDARFLHEFKWITEEEVARRWGKEKTEELEEYYNHLNIDEAEFEYSHEFQFQGYFRRFSNYLIVHTIVDDDDGKKWSIIWSGDVELERTDISNIEAPSQYVVVKLQDTQRTEHYGIFREVVESQKAINQALIKLQLMVNTQKAFVETGSLEGSLEEFTDAFNRVQGVIPVKKLAGVKVVDLTREALKQYETIDKAFSRIQQILSINDSFLGQAFASDSGRKVKLQQNATMMALRYLTIRIQEFYEQLGITTLLLVKQFYTGTQVLAVSDSIVGRRFIELNQPMEIFSGQMDQQGQPIMDTPMEQVLDPSSGEPAEDDAGNLLFAPIPEEHTELNFTKFDLTVEASAFNDEDEKSQLMLETVLQGQIGNMLAQVNPAAFFKAASLAMRTTKTKFAPEISKILEETSVMIGGDQASEEGAAVIAGETQQSTGANSGSPKSQSLKLPTNTNGQ